MNWPCKRGERSIRRHDLVFVSPQGWRAMIAARDDLTGDAQVARWSDRGWPTVGRRAMPGEQPGVALGLPLPPSAGKKRLAIVLRQGDIVSVSRPLLLNDTLRHAPPAWRPTLDRIGELARRHSIEARVFGSLAWQAVTGLDYLTDGSDLDLLLDVDCDCDLDRLCADLVAIEAVAPMRLDGELMRGDGAAVNWREFSSGAREVLVKHSNGIGLSGRDSFVLEGRLS